MRISDWSSDVCSSDLAAHWRILADLLLISVFGGLYIVPLYAIVQQRAEADHKARTIAANNVMNALFMVFGAAAAALLFAIGLAVTYVFLVIAAANVIAAWYVCKLLPTDRKSTRLNSSHSCASRMPSSA